MDLSTVVIAVLASLVVALVFVLFRTASAREAAVQAAAIRARRDAGLDAIQWFMSQPRRKRRQLMTEINKRNFARNTRAQEEEILEEHADEETPDLEVVTS